MTTKKDAPPRTIGAERPLLTGLAFGLTNPKAYPVALAMFSAIVSIYGDRPGNTYFLCVVQAQRLPPIG